MQHILILGGARSGKSDFAQRQSQQSTKQLFYFATASALDEEMAERIAMHQKSRNERWKTVEIRHDLAKALQTTCRTDRLVLVDCLTLWLTRLLLNGHDIQIALQELAQLIPNLPGTTIFVSNEVGYSLVPDYPLGRLFRDWQGKANQIFAAQCDQVIQIVAGLPILLKPRQPLTLISE